MLVYRLLGVPAFLEIFPPIFFPCLVLSGKSVPADAKKCVVVQIASATATGPDLESFCSFFTLSVHISGGN